MSSQDDGVARRSSTRDDGAARQSLTRDEAESRAAQLDVHSVEVELDLTDPSADTFFSRSTVAFASQGPESFADFAAFTWGSATLNGEPLPASTWRRGRVVLTDLVAENVLVVEGEMGYSSDGEGLHRHVDPADGATYLYAMSFLEAAPRWFGCFDQPDLKARYTLRVAAPADWTVLGNGPARRLPDGRWRIEALQPLSTYFVTLVAGPYASVQGEHDGIPLGLHVRASLRAELEQQAPDMLAVTGECFDFYHRVFGIRYPFGEYHQAFVPDFNAGAMENPGCVTFRDSFVVRGRVTRHDEVSRAGVIAHEMAHQWFGDLVTMRWWDDLWLNESFAEYLAHRCRDTATRHPMPIEFGILRKDWGALADQSPSTHPVAGSALDAASALQNFDGISYAKGAAVLKQLAAHLGDEVFLTGLRDYVDRFSYGNATFSDLIAAWGRAGAVGLPDWAHAWLRTTGMDTLDVASAEVGVRVVASAPAGTPVRPHTVRPGAVTADGTLTLLDEIAVNQQPSPVLSLPSETVLVVPDARDETWAKIRFGPDGWPAVAAVLPRLGDESAAVVVFNAIRDAVRNAELDPAVALELFEGAIPAQSDELICHSVLGFALQQLAGSYASRAQRPERLARVRRLVEEVLSRSEPGSDRQLVAFRLAIRTAEDLERLSRWYAGTDLPHGVELDPELAWAVVERRCALNGDLTLLADARQRDLSASGRVHAARAQALLPDPDAKAAAWTLLMEPSTAAAYEVYATAEGFWDAGRGELTDAYVPRYFSEIGDTVRFREGWALSEVAAEAFPRFAADASSMDLAEAALDGELAPPVRRAVVDGADRLRRAVASLDRYAP